MELRIKMPDLATTGSDLRLVRWLVKPGDTVVRGQPLCEVETEKAMLEVESIATGVLKESRVQPDELVSVGQVIAVIELTDGKAATGSTALKEAATETTGPKYARDLLLS